MVRWAAKKCYNGFNMTNKTIDGIQRPRNSGITGQPKIVKLDSMVRRKVVKPQQVLRLQFNVPFRPKSKQSLRANFWRKLYQEQKVPVLAAVAALLLAFGGGMWAALTTTKSEADIPPQPQVLGAFTDQPSQAIALPGNQLQGQDGQTATNDILFTTPLEYLQNYFTSIAEPEIIDKRKNQLTEFLKQKNSPLADAAETIAGQSHWQLILAIAFAESTLGKNCADFNCSNIGVKPGDPAWHKYSSYQAWAVDFNRLLEKKYKDWTLEQMCGVYVKPCNPNWLLATKQILEQLQEQGIE